MATGDGRGGPGKPGTTSRRWQLQVRATAQRVTRTELIKARFGLTVADIFDRGLAAVEAEAKMDLGTQFALNAGRMVRELAAAYDLIAFDPDADYETEQQYLKDMRPRVPNPLREVRRPGTRVRGT